MFSVALHTPIHGAYTELFAGLSPDVTPDNNGAWSKHDPRAMKDGSADI